MVWCGVASRSLAHSFRIDSLGSRFRWILISSQSRVSPRELARYDSCNDNKLLAQVVIAIDVNYVPHRRSRHSYPSWDFGPQFPRTLELVYHHVFRRQKRLIHSSDLFIGCAPSSSTSSLPSRAEPLEGLIYRPPTAPLELTEQNPQPPALPSPHILGISLGSYQSPAGFASGSPL